MADIVDIKTVPVQRGDASTHGMMISVNTDEAGMSAEFVETLAGKILLHRMCSPPDTSVLVVSVVGPFDAAAFRREWVRVLAGEGELMGPLRFFLGSMSTAVLVHGKRDGTVLQEVRLAPA